MVRGTKKIPELEEEATALILALICRGRALLFRSLKSCTLLPRHLWNSEVGQGSRERPCCKVLLKDEIQRFGDLERSGCPVPQPSA